MLSKEELLKPRYKVIADYPDSHYELGSVLDRDWARYPEDDETKPAIWRISQFPHLFKKMSWWEEREESDMPEYLKTKDNKVWKAQKHFYTNRYGTSELKIDIERFIREKDLESRYEYFIPATREEYEQYQQSQLKIKT